MKGKGKAKKQVSTSSHAQEPSTQSATASTPSEPPAPEPSSPSYPANLPPAISEARAELYLWDKPKGYFTKVDDVLARLVKADDGAEYVYWLTAAGQGGQVLAHTVSSDMNQRWSAKVQSLTWNNQSSSGEQTSWCFRFATLEDFENFQSEFTKVHWETLHRYPWGKMRVGYRSVRFYWVGLNCTSGGRAAVCYER